MTKPGFLLVKKPKNITSHDVVDRLRKISGIKKIGHSGTLDPFATGLLILGIGKGATKKLSRFLKADKEYIGLLKLGAVSDTFDKTGKILEKEKIKKPTKDEVKKVLESFLGEINQTPPLFSAQKIKGKPLYQLARKGIKIKPRAKKVKVNKIEILNYSFPYLKIKVKCSSGTYIRSLANDIGKTLGCGAYLEELKRTKIGSYSLEKAVELSKINKENWQKFLYKL
ncbi:MAG TPA: tRNA pseudouridine(55) synthase TruB [Candidatus Parcubacteria bacterium]|nr:tRNA pseudouridine(55) synthase TruB [Candidatus Parcubacteria bacterium]